MAILLAAWTAVQPAIVAAAGIVAAIGGAPGTQPGIDVAGNGVPLVNIAAPNAVGVSHNRYEAFSVDARGTILNNAPVTTQTQLGGYIEGNPNLAAGSASLILNEVTGDERSSLAGYIEVGGVPAEVVIANPNGITCNGCGFINMPRATLSTGTPTLDTDGSLTGFRVQGGDITVRGLGVNADNVDVFELLCRAVLLQAEVYANELRVTTGAGVLLRNGDALEEPPAGPSPAFAIDSTALGGIYANRIRMVANEDGVGVRIQAPIAAQAGSLLLAASGELSLTGAQVAGPDVSIEASRINIDAGAGVYADSNGVGVAALRADVIDNRGLVQADTLQIVAGTTLLNHADPLSAQAGTIIATTLTAETPLFDNRTGIVSIRNGTDDGLRDEGIGRLDNRGGLLLLGSTSQAVDVGIDNSGGRIRHTGSGVLTIVGDHGLLNDGGEISGASAVVVRTDGEWHNDGGLLHADDLLHLWLPEITGIPAGVLSAGRELHLQSDGDISLTGLAYTAPSGLMLTAAGNVSLSGSSVGADDSVNIAASGLVMDADSVLFAGSDLAITLGGDLLNEGLLFATGDITVGDAREIHNGSDSAAGAIVSATGDITLLADAGIYNVGSLIESMAGDVFIGSAERSVPVFDNRRTGLLIGVDAWTEYDWSSFHGNDGWFPDDAWWIEHCYHRYGGCGYPDLVDLAVDEENARITTENQARAAQGLPPLALIDYKSFDPADYVGVTQYLDDNLGYDDAGWRRDSWIYAGDHENRRYVRREDLVSQDVLLLAGRAARLLAGNDITIHAGNALNENSLVSGGADVSITADSLTNVSRTLTETTVSNWWSQGYMCDSDGCWLFGMVPEGYPPTATLTQAVGAIPSVIEAGGTLSITGGDVQNTGSYADVGWQPSGFFGGPPPDSDPVTTGLPPDIQMLPSDGSLFRINDGPGHRYLVETNPVLATYAGFLGSDYLLGRLGLDPDATTQRLGDAYYEMTLVRESLLALTGSRLLPYAFGDEQAQFAWLLENGVYAAHALQLSVGVALTPDQVNALTADIVWLEERRVAGRAVLVPVVYLVPGSAEVSGTGALLAASQVAIDAVALENSGTVSAGTALALQVDTMLTNHGGVLQSEGELLAIASGDIANKSGTIRGAGDVALVSTGGNVLNETITRQQAHTLAGVSTYETQVGRQAQIRAGEALSLIAAGDVVIAGAAVDAAAVELQAGGSVTVESVGWGAGGTWQDGNWVDDHVRQLQASISALTDILVSAEEDVTLVGATLAANRDVALYAGNNLLVTAASESDYAFRHSEKETSSGHSYATDIVERTGALGSGISVGGNISAQAGNIQVVASRLAAAGRIDLRAAGTVALLSAVETAYTLHDSKRTGELGREVATRDERSVAISVASEVQAGSAIAITSSGSQVYEAARITAGGDVTLASETGEITFGAAFDATRSSYEHTDGDLAWRASEGHGAVDETARLTEIVAAGQLAIEAARGLTIDIRQIDEQTVSEAIDALVAGNPRLGWLKEAEARGDVDWRQVEEVHDAWQYDEQSLGEGAALAISIVVTVLTSAAGTAVVGEATTALSAAANAAVTSAAAGATTSATIALINNGGNLGEAISALDEQNSVEEIAVSSLASGFTAGVIDPRLGVRTDPLLGTTRGFNLASLDDVARFSGHAGAQALSQAGISALVIGGNFESALDKSLRSQLGNVLTGIAFFHAGSAADHWRDRGLAPLEILTDGVDQNGFWAEGGLARTGIHALAGGVTNDILNDDFATGALAAATSQLAAPTLTGWSKELGLYTGYNYNQLHAAGSQLAGLLGAAVIDGDVNEGAYVALQADQYNRQLHDDEIARIRSLAGGDKNLENRLLVASCALVLCAAQYAVNSPEYRNAIELERIGRSNEYAYERSLLARQLSEPNFLGGVDQLFSYGKTDRTLDAMARFDSAHGVVTRALGAIQVTGGVAFAGSSTAFGASAAASCPISGVGCAGVAVGAAGAVMGADLAASGAAMLWHGRPVNSFGGALIADALGISPDQGEMIYAMFSVPVAAKAFSIAGDVASIAAMPAGVKVAPTAERGVVSTYDQVASGRASSDVPAASQAALAVPDSAVASGASGRGVAFFGRDNLHYYAPAVDGSAPSLGGNGRAFFFMPIDDAAHVSTPAGAAIQSGFAPSAEKAWRTGNDIFGVSFPLNGMQVRAATEADARGWPNFLDGGYTAVNVPETDWFLVNKTREFVVDGGISSLSQGSVIFRLGDQGEWIPMWRH